ncbi:MBL fold metallo-hydrolase [Clostridium sp. MCC353]|uniref:MBL fold metallo-hydrolase n=1 Tax=Clostridium sp. MCC353 TaxID=2592646 RepID=UPI0031FE5F03
MEPIKMAPGVWYISGNDWVACYLIDTGDGLILIDTAMHETAYLMIENIRKLGYELTDIKKILLTHAHIDHIGAARTMKELTGARIYLGERDLLFLHERRDLIRIGSYTCGEFEPDELYADDKPITLGNITVHTVSTPGHTPGCTSMFFDVKDENGRALRCGIHGGIGLNLTKDDFERDGLPQSLRDEFIEGLKRLDQMQVDICLPSHTNQVGILLLKDQVTETYNPYIDPSIWHELMNERLERVMEIVKSENG